MSSCPPEWAAQVNAVHDPPFSAKDAPLGRWFKNNQGNVCLTLPDNSYYYFNVGRDWYFLQREPDKPDRDCESIYISPPGDRYYNPSKDTRQAGSSFIGVLWRSLSEKVCNTDHEDKIYFTFRKLFDASDLPDLPRKHIAIFTNQAGSQRVVEVDQTGVYNGNAQWVIDEINYWLANLVPVDNVDGPRWRRAQARQLTPPAEGEQLQGVGMPSNRESARGSSSRAGSPSVKKEEELETQIMEREDSSESDHSFDGMGRSSRASTGSIKTEVLDTQSMGGDGASSLSSSESDHSFDGSSDNSRASSPSIKKEELDEMAEAEPYESGDEEMDEDGMEDEEMKHEDSAEPKDVPTATGSGRACMRALLAARRPKVRRVVQGARVNKKNVARRPVRDIGTRE